MRGFTIIDVLNKRVQINGRTWAMAKRFSGKHGGYKKVTRLDNVGEL
jgi:hypothetical protein